MSLTPFLTAFRRLVTVVLVAGTIAGLLLAALQLVAVAPLIHTAEAYENAELSSSAAALHGDHEWQPSEGFERSAYTVLATMLSGVAFSALLFGVASLLGLELDRRRGLWLGLGGFACCALAPAIGLPPRPPGGPAAELRAAQVWWWTTALATAVGLWAIVRAERRWTWRGAGLTCLLVPHVVGAPQAVGSSAVPPDLIWRFAVVSIATQAVFWLLLGSLGSHLYARWLRGLRSDSPTSWRGGALNS